MNVCIYICEVTRVSIYHAIIINSLPYDLMLCYLIIWHIIVYFSKLSKIEQKCSNAKKLQIKLELNIRTSTANLTLTRLALNRCRHAPWYEVGLSTRSWMLIRQSKLVIVWELSVWCPRSVTLHLNLQYLQSNNNQVWIENRINLINTNKQQMTKQKYK